jgi:ferredoxin
VEFVGRATGDAPVGVTLLEAAKLLDVDIDHFCGGRCSCGTCRVEVDEPHRLALSKLELNEQAVLGPHAVRRGDRLACQARILGPLTLTVPDFFIGS